MKARLTAPVLARLPRDREVSSLHVSADPNRSILIKFRLWSGKTELMLAPMPVASHVRNCLDDAWEKLGWRIDRESPAALSFLAKQPEVTEADRRMLPDGNNVAEGIEVHVDPTAVFLAFQVQPETFKVFKLRAVTALWLRQYIHEIERAGAGVDLSAAPAKLSS